MHDPLKQRKLSPMDLESRRRWESYTRAKEAMLERTHIAEAPLWVVQAVDKKPAELNCIDHLLRQFRYAEIEHAAIELPDREKLPDYTRQPVPVAMMVPEVYSRPMRLRRLAMSPSEGGIAATTTQFDD